jgi:nitric oxide reductase NorD protein
MNDIDRYSLLANAVAGRRVRLARSVDADPLAGSDSRSITLPRSHPPDDGETWREVVAQAALIGAGSLQVQFVRHLIGKPVPSRRYVFLEVLRASRLLAHRLPMAFLELPALQSMKPYTSTAAESLQWALSGRSLPQTPAFFGRLRPFAVLRAALGDGGVGALTHRQSRANPADKGTDELDDDESAEDSKLLRLFENPLFGRNRISDLLNKILGTSTARQRDRTRTGGGGAEAPVGQIEATIRRGIHSVMSRLKLDLSIDPRSEPGTLSFPEWDELGKKYRDKWAFVEEVEAWRPDGERDLSQILRPAGYELRRQLTSLGLNHETHNRQQDGTDFDLSRLLDCAIEMAAGHAPPALNIYRSSRRTRRDLAVAIAVDISGSTEERNAQGESIFDQQLRTAYQLGRTLNDIGDTVALFGFHSWGRKRVHVVRLKGAEEAWSGRVAERFSRLDPVGYTRTGAAIRFANHMLQTQMRLPNRLLILITDGISYDQDYESSYAEGDARKALRETRTSGAACVCLCVGGSSSADKLRTVFGAANLLIVDESRQITMQIRNVCRKALASVSHRNRRVANPAG